MRVLASAFAFVILLFLLLHFFLTSGGPAESEMSDAPLTVQELTASPPNPVSGEVDVPSKIHREFLPAGGCLTEEQLYSHPVMAKEASRLAPFSVMLTEEISAYRGLTEDELLPLIQQGDSAAMAVMGAIEVMRARGEPDSKAVPYLMLEGEGYVRHGPVSPDQTQHYERAIDWFYEAALHGRVLALMNVGNVMTMQQKTPVKLGWISEEAFSSLTRAQNSVFNAANVYQGLAYTIAPELEIGLFDEGDGFFGTQAAKKYSEIIKPIHTKFEQDRIRRGLPTIEVPDSELPPLSELEAIICPLHD